MKIAIFWDIALCGPYINRPSSETSAHMDCEALFLRRCRLLHRYRCENLRSFINREAVFICNVTHLIMATYAETCNATNLRAVNVYVWTASH
jgi:hypothetical protein